jgi:hypothetical protein
MCVRARDCGLWNEIRVDEAGKQLVKRSVFRSSCIYSHAAGCLQEDPCDQDDSSHQYRNCPWAAVFYQSNFLPHAWVPTREQLPILLHQELQRCTKHRLISVDFSSTEEDDEYFSRRYPSWNSRLDATRRVLLGWLAVDQTMQCPNS